MNKLESKAPYNEYSTKGISIKHKGELNKIAIDAAKYCVQFMTSFNNLTFNRKGI